MKKIATIIAIIAGFSIQAQTLEKTYTNEQAYYFQVSPTDGVWAAWQSSTKTMRIYNLQHNLIKTIVANVPDNLPTVNFVSKTLFNNNNEFEFLLSGSGSVYVIQEDGNPAFSKVKDGSNSYSGYVYNTANGTKLWLVSASATEIYSLPGKIIMGKKEISQESNEILPYPNPASDLLFIPEAQGMLHIDITDASGRFAKRLNVDGAAVDIRDLTPGMYFYTVKGVSQSFIKQ